MTDLTTLANIAAIQPLTGSTYLRGYALEAFGGKEARRTDLFKLPNFRREFYALPQDDQDKLWAQLMVNTNGTLRELLNYETLTRLFVELCRRPGSFDWHATATNPADLTLSCPEWYLREKMAERLEQCIASDTAIPQGVSTFTNPETGNTRTRIRYADSVSDKWYKAMRAAIISTLPDTTFTQWLKDKSYQRVLVHEITALDYVSKGQRIELWLYNLLSHPTTLRLYTPSRGSKMYKAQRSANSMDYPVPSPLKNLKRSPKQLNLFPDAND